MRSNYLKATLKTVSLGIIVLLCITAAPAQVTVGLTATRQTALMADGTTVPMWGWFCNHNVLSGTTTTVAVPGGGTCSTLAGVAQIPGTAGAPSVVWQPPLITVPTGTALTITLTDSLPVATSLTIVGGFSFESERLGRVASVVEHSSGRNEHRRASTVHAL